MENRLSRRAFLLGTSCALLLPAASLARVPLQSPRTLKLDHLHTGEKLRLEYHDGHRYLDDALAEAARFLRDFRSGETHPVDPGVLDILWELQEATDSSQRSYQVISAYRSPATNAKLRKRSKGVAKRSLHMQGKAIDVRLAGFDTRTLYRAACGLKRGGVGCYSRSDFIHLDTGRVRTWGS